MKKIETIECTLQVIYDSESQNSPRSGSLNPFAMLTHRVVDCKVVDKELVDADVTDVSCVRMLKEREEPRIP